MLDFKNLIHIFLSHFSLHKFNPMLKISAPEHNQLFQEDRLHATVKFTVSSSFFKKPVRARDVLDNTY